MYLRPAREEETSMRDEFKGIENLTHRTRFGDVYCAAGNSQAIIRAGGHTLYINIEEARVIRRWLNEAIDASVECPVCHQPLAEDEIRGSCMHGGPRHRSVSSSTQRGNE
jgi:hypothetical protein